MQDSSKESSNEVKQTVNLGDFNKDDYFFIAIISEKKNLIYVLTEVMTIMFRAFVSSANVFIYPFDHDADRVGERKKVLNDNELQKMNAFQQLAVANLYLRNQLEECRRICILCFASTILLFIIRYFIHDSVPAIKLSIVLFSIVVLAWIRAALLAYRIANGYFGNNRPEVSSLICFIIDKSDDIDSSGGDRRKKVYPTTVQGESQENLDGLQGVGV